MKQHNVSSATDRWINVYITRTQQNLGTDCDCSCVGRKLDWGNYCLFFIVCNLIKVIQNNGVITLPIQRHGVIVHLRPQKPFLHIGQPSSAAPPAVHHDLVRTEHILHAFKMSICWMNIWFLRGTWLHVTSTDDLEKRITTLCTKWLVCHPECRGCESTLIFWWTFELLTSISNLVSSYDYILLPLKS